MNLKEKAKKGLSAIYNNGSSVLDVSTGLFGGVVMMGTNNWVLGVIAAVAMKIVCVQAMDTWGEADKKDSKLKNEAQFFTGTFVLAASLLIACIDDETDVNASKLEEKQSVEMIAQSKKASQSFKYV